MARDLNFAVVGLGMGGHHCMAINGAKGAHLAAVCDLDKQRVESRKKEFGADKGYGKFEDVLKDKDIDVVCIVTESGYHTEMGIKAARAGKHIIMEKPIDVALSRIKKFEGEVKKCGVKCGCIFQSRMDNANIMIKKAIDAGKMGKLIGAHASLPWFRSNEYYSGKHGAWHGTWKLDGGGSMMNQGIHTVDLIQWLAGPVESVFGYAGVFSHKIEAEDQTVAVLKFKNGALGTFFSTTCAIPESAQRLYMYGSKGSFSKFGNTVELFEMGTKSERERMLKLFGNKEKQSDVGKDPMAVSADGHTLIIEDMVKAVRSNREPAITIASGTHAVEIACAIYKSVKTGKEVKIKEVAK